MHTMLNLKLFLYRLLSTKLGKNLLKFLSFGVKAKNLGNPKSKNKPFLIAITIDTESGYVSNNERRVWQRERPEAFEGYYYGMRNLLSVFKYHNIKCTFL